jgi:sugar lactone lactonase YvrE
MNDLVAHPVLHVRAALGERPVWDDRRGELAWVDIERGELHRYTPGGEDRVSVVANHAGCVALRDNGGFVIGTDEGIRLLDDSGETEGELIVPPGMTAGHAFNDGSCDPAGRFFAGTATVGRTPGASALYRLEADHSIHIAIEGVAESNGIAWSPDAATMYYIDSGTQHIQAYHYDPSRGHVGRGRILITIEEAGVIPDGLIVDAEGYLWVGLWGGSAVRRYSPDGRLDAVVGVPTSHVTCPAFGGPDLGDLYITTATADLTEEQAAAQPLAGDLFLSRPGVTGLPALRYAG